MTGPVGELFAQYHGSLVRMLYRRTGDRDRAEEIAQETFARAVAAPPRNPRPWLFAVALNLIREEARAAVRQDRRLVLYRAEQPDRAAAPDEELDRSEKIARVRAALELLSERDREALLLKAEGFNYDEIAATLGLARGAIGTTLARARRRLVDAYRAGEEKQHVAS
jgi:RNA polymerase sigma-70 factor (ECF subfamily)